MTKNKTTDIVASIVEMLNPLSTEERTRVVRASLTLLGDDTESNDIELRETTADGGTPLSSKAKIWMKQNGLSLEDLQQVFHFSPDDVAMIAEIPGKSTRERVNNAYVLTGLTGFLLSGDQGFDDKSAKALCKASGCYDGTNHAKYVKDRGNAFAGSKEKGWTLTAPGLKHGAQLVKELNAAK